MKNSHPTLNRTTDSPPKNAVPKNQTSIHPLNPHPPQTEKKERRAGESSPERAKRGIIIRRFIQKSSSLQAHLTPIPQPKAASAHRCPLNPNERDFKASAGLRLEVVCYFLLFFSVALGAGFRRY